MCYHVEVTRNYFQVVFVDLSSYLKIFSDCVDNDGKAIPLVDKLTIAEIKQRLETIPKKRFVLYEDDDTDLFSLLYWLQQKADYLG